MYFLQQMAQSNYMWQLSDCQLLSSLTRRHSSRHVHVEVIFPEALNLAGPKELNSHVLFTAHLVYIGSSVFTCEYFQNNRKIFGSFNVCYSSERTPSLMWIFTHLVNNDLTHVYLIYADFKKANKNVRDKDQLYSVFGLGKVYQTFHFRRSWAHRGCSGLLECDNGHSLSSRDSCAFIEIGHQWKMESPISYYSPRLPKYHLDSKFGDQEDNFLRMFFLLLLGWIFLSKYQNWNSQCCLNYSQLKKWYL